MELSELEKKVMAASRKAGKLMLNTRDFRISLKNNDSGNIVTSVDVAVQNYLIKTLKEILPESSFYAEENEMRQMNDGYVWIIDPIDGTMNFAYDLKMSCTSIGLIYNNKPVLGVIYDPYNDECYHATKNNGAFLNDKPIHVNHNKMKDSLCICGTSPYAKGMADKTFDIMKKCFLASKDIRRTGSACLDFCHIAAGKADCFHECQLAPWDYCAGAFILEEAGGIVQTIEPDVWGYTRSIRVIAGTPENFEALRSIVIK